MQRTPIIVTTDAEAVSTQRAGESHIYLYRLEGGGGRHYFGHLDSDNMAGVSIIFKIRVFYKAQFEGFEFL